mgnify:CR=1 FL=1|jgi:hypothetical protein
MKNLIIILVTVMFATSCTPPPPDTSALDAGMEMFNKNKAIADKTFNLFIAKDLDGMMDIYSDDVNWSPANTLDSLSKDALREGMTGWMTEFEVFSFNDRQYYPGVDENFVPDGSVRTYGTWVGTHNSGATTVSKYYSVTQYNDEGKIITALEWFDVGGVFDQVETQLQN